MKQFQAVLMILLSLSVFALGQVNAQEDDHFLLNGEVINVDSANQLKEVATLSLGTSTTLPATSHFEIGMHYFYR